MTAGLLTFDAARHEYRRPDGARVPSVTEILRAVGVSVDFAALGGFGERAAAAIERKRAIGAALHADAHSYDDDDLDLARVHADVLPYLEAWAICRSNLGLVPIVRERRLYSPALEVAGTVDAICQRAGAGDRLILIELKTGDVLESAARFQTAGYALLWNLEHGDRLIAERWAVELTPDHKHVPYRVHKFTDWRDERDFRAFVTTYYRQAARRGPA